MDYPFADYDFYIDTYGGTAVSSESEWAQPAMLASIYIESIANKPITDDLDDSTLVKVKLAVCALAEIEYASSSTAAGIIASESVGSRSVTYSNDAKSMEKRRASLAMAYLALTGLIGGTLR